MSTVTAQPKGALEKSDGGNVAVVNASPYKSEGIYSDDGKTLIEVKENKPLFIIPDGITTISERAFSNCVNITELVIPSTVNVIGTCPYSLKNIYYKGTKDDWKKVNADKLNKSIAVYFYSEAKPKLFDNSWHYASDGITPEVTGISINNVRYLIMLMSK